MTTANRTVSQARARYDGYANTLTGLGVANRDKRMGTKAQVDIMTEGEAEQIYAADYIAAKMVDTIAEDMVREGFDLIVPGMDEEQMRKLGEYMEYNLNWKQKYQEALSWARLYGGSAILLGVDDGSAKLEEPLNWEKITRFDYLTLFHCFELRAGDIQNDPSEPGYGLPLTYTLQAGTSTGLRIVQNGFGTVIHASRLLRFDGCRLPRRAFQTNQYWHDSILNKRKTVLADYATAYDSVAALMGNVAQSVTKMKDLSEIMNAPDGKAMLQERIDLLDMGRSILGTMLLDENESWEQIVTELGGVPETLNKFEHRLVTHSEYPHTILLGQGPAGGLGETGKSELRDYYDAVSRRQETQLKPQLKMMIRAMFLDKNGPTKGKEPDSWDIKFIPLWQSSQSEVLEQRGKQATIDEVYIRSSVLSPEEVAQARFGSGEFSHETTLVYDRGISGEGAIDVSADTKDSGPYTQEDATPAPATGVDATPAKPSETGVAAANKVTSAQESLNGAQVTSLLDVITQVAAGQLPRASGVAIIRIAFALSEENAESVMGEVGKSFEAKPAVAGKAGNPNPAQAPAPTSGDLSSLDR